jgi:hypothetical protein
MKSLSEATAKIAGRSFERKYIALGRIVSNWREIAGENLADKAQPVKLYYRKKKKDAGKPTATLEVAASSADSTKMHYQKGLMLERINQIFGEEWITDIKFVAVVANAKPLKKAKKPPAPLTEEEKKTLSGMVLDIADEEIKDALLSLGQGIISKEKS